MSSSKTATTILRLKHINIRELLTANEQSNLVRNRIQHNHLSSSAEMEVYWYLKNPKVIDCSSISSTGTLQHLTLPATVFRINSLKRHEELQKKQSIEQALGRGGRMAAAAGYVMPSQSQTLQPRQQLSAISQRALQNITNTEKSNAHLSSSSSGSLSRSLNNLGSTLQNRVDFMAIGSTVLVPNMKTLHDNAKKRSACAAAKINDDVKAKKQKTQKAVLDKEIEMLLGENMSCFQ